jgi:hypothetical protein
VIEGAIKYKNLSFFIVTPKLAWVVDTYFITEPLV